VNELALFAGAGGGILGGHLLGWRTVCAVEIEPFCREVLLRRQMDGCLPEFPIWDDVQTFDGKPWRGCVDVVSGGFPCQDISAAGRGAGIDGARSGLWSHMARIVGEVRPRFVFVENSPMLVRRGLAVVLGDLASLGYDARWCVLGADDVGAPHIRKRIWIVANASQHFGNARVAESAGQQRKAWTADGGEDVADAQCTGLEGHRGIPGNPQKPELGDNGASDAPVADAEDGRDVRRIRSMGDAECGDDTGGSEVDGRGQWWGIEPDVGRVANGVANRVDRLRAIGNGQVPAVAAAAWVLLSARHNDRKGCIHDDRP
jgi:DNA (cytosine-5)-methyltransferase 1